MGSIKEDLVHVLDRRAGRQPEEEARLAGTTPASAAPPCRAEELSKLRPLLQLSGLSPSLSLLDS